MKQLLALVIIGLLTLAVITVDAGEPGTYKPEGKGYFFYLHDASEGDGQSNSFDFSRMYFGAKYYLSDEFTIHYLTDIGHQTSYSYDSDEDKLSNKSNGKLEAFSKYAYLDWKIQDNLHLLMGLQGTYNWKQPENAWGYRAIQYSPMEAFGQYWGGWAKDYKSYLEDWAETDLEKENDASNFAAASRSKMGSSADLGVAVKFKPTKDAYIDFMIRNGLGYKSAEDDRFKNFQLRTGIFLLDEALHISGYLELEPWKGVDSGGKAKGYINTQWDLMASYTVKDVLTVGVDANSKVFTGIEDITATCISLFGNGPVIPKKLNALARLDIYSTGFNDAQFQPGDAKWKSNAKRIIIGLDYKAHKNVSIIPNLQIVTYEDPDEDPTNSVYVHVYFKL